MKQRKPEIGTRRDLVLYRLETAKNEICKSVICNGRLSRSK